MCSVLSQDLFATNKIQNFDDLANNITENLTESTKCGEVHFKNEFLLFTCNLCEQIFQKINSFICHFMKCHFSCGNIEYLLEQILHDDVKKSYQTNVADTNGQENEFLDDVDSLIGNHIQETDLSDNPQIFEEENDFRDTEIDENLTNLEQEPEEDDDEQQYDCNTSKESFLEENDGKVDENNRVKVKNKSYSSIICQVCNESFSNLTDYKQHESSHENERSHENESSQRKYKYKYDNKRFVCESCGKCFKTNYHLTQHQHLHSGVRPYKCELCPQTFAKTRHMVFHMRYHTNDRRYKCQYCDKAFVEQTKRRLHEMIHTGTFPFQCSFCDKGFRCRSKLNVHLKRHENNRMYQCNKCDKSFFDKNLLNGHAAVHSDEKPFACEVCPARFPRKGALRLHMHLHSDKKRYCCKICSKEFHQYNGIYTHMKSHGIKYSTAYEKGECDGKNEADETDETSKS